MNVKPVKCVCGHKHTSHEAKTLTPEPYGGRWFARQSHSGACTAMIGFERCKCPAFKKKDP